MSEIKKPCFENGFEKLSDVMDCLEGTPEAIDCNHLCKGGTWETCNQGGGSRYIQLYKDSLHIKSWLHDSHQMPCFDDCVLDCLEGTTEAGGCTHLEAGGTWETCHKGGLRLNSPPVMLPQNGYFDDNGEWPQAELSLRAMTEADYLALVREVKNLARIVRRMSIEALNPNLIFEELSEVIDALAKLEDEAK